MSRRFEPKFYHLVLDKILLWSAFIVCLIVQVIAYYLMREAVAFHEFLKNTNTLFAGGLLMHIKSDVSEIKSAWSIANGKEKQDALPYLHEPPSEFSRPPRNDLTK